MSHITRTLQVSQIRPTLLLRNVVSLNKCIFAHGLGLSNVRNSEHFHTLRGNFILVLTSTILLAHDTLCVLGINSSSASDDCRSPTGTDA